MFDWMRPAATGVPATTAAERRREMYLAELAERAALLMRLGHGRDAARARLAARVRWDFEGSEDEKGWLAELDGVVNRVFTRGSRRNG